MTSADHPTRTPAPPFWNKTERPRTSILNSGDDEASALAAEIIASGDLNDRLGALQGAMSEPSVSILAGTTPGKGMTKLDAAQLQHLLSGADQRLRQAGDTQRASGVRARLAQAVSIAQAGPTQSGLAIFVSEDQTAIVPLPFAPNDRVLVGPWFATRDLLYALQRFPAYRLLVIAGPAFRLLEGRGNHLTEISATPSVRESGSSVVDAFRGRCRSGLLWHGPRTTRGRCRAVLLAAEHLLDQATATRGELPLVVVASPRLLRAFRTSSGHARSLIGEVSGWYPQTSGDRLAMLAQSALDRWYAERRAQALLALTSAERVHSVAWGVHAALNAVRLGGLERLWVDHDYSVPARLNDDGSIFEQATRESIGVIDDVIERIIQMSVGLGIRVDILDGLARAHPDAIAVQLRCSAVVLSPVPTCRSSRKLMLTRQSRSPPTPLPG
jgi:Bacterial archaeo-eukaryotic release factor family 3